jgi:hypothetical protein
MYQQATLELPHTGRLLSQQAMYRRLFELFTSVAQAQQQAMYQQATLSCLTRVAR